MFVSLFRCSLSYLFIFVCLLFRPIYNMLMHNNTSSCAFWSAQWIEIYIIDFLALMQVRIDIMVSLERAQGCTRRRLPCSLGQSAPASWTGGLRISDLKSLGWALRMRWLWLQKTDPLRPWANLPIRVPDQVQAFFSVAITSEIGDGTRTLFWPDRWLHGQSIAGLAPRFCGDPKEKDKAAHCQRSSHQPSLDFRYRRSSHSWCDCGISPHMRSPSWYWITSRGGGLSYLETLAQRSILGRVGLWRFLLWFHPFWTVGKNLENLGTGKMKNFLVVGCIW